MNEDMFGNGMNPALNPGLSIPGSSNADIAKQMAMLNAGRLRGSSVASQQQQQQQQQRMVPPVPPNAPDKQRASFLNYISQVLAPRGLVLPPFVTGQPNPAWMPDSGPLKHIQPASDNRPGALRMPGAAPGRAGDIDLFKLWTAVTNGGGMQRITAAGQWETVAAHIGHQLPQHLPGTTHPPAGQLAQLYFTVLAPLEEHMKRQAQAKQAHILALQNQNQSQNPGGMQQQQSQQPLTPAQMHQHQQSNQASGLMGMQPPGMGGMPNMSGMQSMGGMPGSTMGGMQNQSMGVNMTPAQMHQQHQQQPGQTALGMGGQMQTQNPMLTPAQMHAMGAAAGMGGAGMGMGAGIGMGMGTSLGGVGNPVVGGTGSVGMTPGLGMGGAMPPPAPMMQNQPDAGLAMNLGLGGGLGIGPGKRKSEPDEDEKRAKAKVGDPSGSTPTPTAATPVAGPPSGPPRRTKIEYVPLRLDVETYGGRALDNMIASGGTMDRPVRDISELGTVDISALTLCLRARTPNALSHALGALAILSAHSQQTFPLARCEDLVDTLVEVLESAAWGGEDWAGGALSAETEFDRHAKPDDGEEEWVGDEEEVPIRTHRELVRMAAEMGLGMRAKGRGWDGGEVIARAVKMEEGEEEDIKMEEEDQGHPKRSYEDIAPPGMARSDVVITIVRLLRNFSLGHENCPFLAREGSKVVDVLAGLIGFKEGKLNPGDGGDLFGFVGDGLWDNGVEVAITPLSSALTLPQLLRVRKDVLCTISNLAPCVRLSASSPAPRRLFTLLASFILDPADTRSPCYLYQHLPQRRFSLSTDLALDALTKIAQTDQNRTAFQQSVQPILLRATFEALVKMLPNEPNDMLLIARYEAWMAYVERVALSLYALACCAPASVRRDIRTQRASGAAVLRMMCRLAQYDPESQNVPKVGGAWVQRNPFACLVRRVVEALRVIDEPEEGTSEVIGWPVRGGQVEGDKGSGWLAGVSADDALSMMVIEGIDAVTFEDLEMLTRVGEVGA